MSVEQAALRALAELGLAQFRPLQLQAIAALCEGQGETLDKREAARAACWAALAHLVPSARFWYTCLAGAAPKARMTPLTHTRPPQMCC